MSDLPSLKKRHGNNIVFCGGIDTHRILPYGSPPPENVLAMVDAVQEFGHYPPA